MKPRTGQAGIGMPNVSQSRCFCQAMPDMMRDKWVNDPNLSQLTIVICPANPLIRNKGW